MYAEVLAIGDELTSGERLDTNSQWISQRLAEIGVPVRFHTTVGDDLSACTDAFRVAMDRVEVVVSSGGLGPTADDLTRQAIAAALGVELVLDKPSLAAIADLFARRGRTMPDSNRIQAMFPAGSAPIANPHGTAPGIAVQSCRPAGHDCRLFALPGVPAELREMWSATVRPAVVSLQPVSRTIRHRRLKCFGVGESQLESLLPDLIRRGREPTVGITVSQATITLRITASGRTHDDCLTAMQPTIDTIRSCLGTLVFGEEDDELQHAVTRLLAARGETLSTVEWGTGGQLAHWLSDVPEAESVFRGGLVIGSDVTARDLGPEVREALAQHGPYSAQLAAALSLSAGPTLAADYVLAISDLPAIDTNCTTDEWFGIARKHGTDVVQSRHNSAGHPDIRLVRAAKQALNVLRLELMTPPQG
ncbi:MAG: CinA family nicotinamide mononucleotide deamidase-related protein [Pirellulales bacterium]